MAALSGSSARAGRQLPRPNRAIAVRRFIEPSVSLAVCPGRLKASRLAALGLRRVRARTDSQPLRAEHIQPTLHTP